MNANIVRRNTIVVIILLITMNLYSQAPPVTSVGTAVFSAGTYSVPINVSGFVNAGNISLTLNYNPAYLVYTGVTLNGGLIPGLSVSTPVTDQSGVFRFSYSSQVAIALVAPLNTLLTLTFTPKPGIGGVQSLLTWSTVNNDNEITPPIPAVYVPQITQANMSTYFINGSFEIQRMLNLAVFLEGLYAGTGIMNQAQGIAGNQFPGTIADQLTIELHDAVTYASIIYTQPNVALDRTGLGIATIPSVFSGLYYITVKHKNSITTVSAVPVSFATGTVSYNFTNLVTQAFGNNMKNSGGNFLFFGGDVNQDNIIDLGDLITVGNQALLASNGYLSEDVNGDGLVDLSDIVIVGNNASLAVSSITP
jgi:hypothetical protein